MSKVSILCCLVSFLFINIGCKNKADLHKKTQTKAAIVKEKWHWGNAKKQSESAGYAQVVKVGNTIYISGVPSSDLSPKGITEVYKTLGECLKAFGATPKDVVKETLYTTDIETMKKYNESRKAFYANDFPAATWVQISRLYEANAKLEIDLVAHIGNEDD